MPKRNDITKEELEMLKKEKLYTFEEVKKADEVQEFLKKTFGIKVDDIDYLLSLYYKFFDDVQNIVYKKSGQMKKTVAE